MSDRRKRLDRRSHCYWRMLHHWVKSRCESTKSRVYKDYGAKGIKCLLTWKDIVKLWFRDNAWMMLSPELDRINPDGHYEWDNCRFIEKSENLKRRRFASKKEMVL